MAPLALQPIDHAPRGKPTSMPHRQRLLAAFALALAVVSGARAASDAAVLPVAASAPAAKSHGDALAQCETAVDKSIHEIRGKQVGDLQFGADARAVSTDGDRVDVKGSGRYRRGAGAPIPFTYSCAYDEASGATSGVLFREADTAATPPLPVWQADLSKISPEACEAAAAKTLQANHPRASGIVFDGDTRKLGPGAEGRTALSGTGRMVPAPGMNPGKFKYRCEFDAEGRLAAAAAGD